MRRPWLAWLLIAGCLAPAARAADPPGSGAPRLLRPDIPVELKADSLEYEAGRDLYVARGHVWVRQGPRELHADWASFNARTRRGVASGDVTYSDGNDSLKTRFIEFDLDTLQGVMFDAEFLVDSGRMQMRGEEVAKTGDRTWSIRKGEFTTCRCPDPKERVPWEIHADKTDVEVNGYGTARNASTEILGVPVLWLPWMIYPVKTKRQSGILFPQFAVSGRNGVEIGLPIFWAAGDPVNVVVTPSWLQKRGPKGNLDVQYVMGERSGGSASGAFLVDQNIHEDTRKTPFDDERWATWGDHDLDLPGGWRFQTKYAFTSDNSYTFDFSDLRQYRTDRHLAAVAFAGRSYGEDGRFGVEAGAQWDDDQQNPSNTDRTDFLLQRLPEVTLRALPAPLAFARWLVPSLGLDYAWYQQQDRPQSYYTDMRLVTSNGRFFDTGIDGIPDSREQGRTGTEAPPDRNMDDFATNGGPENDGRFQEGELLADSGHRFLFTPRLGAPLRLFDAVEVDPEVGWHQTLYASDAQGFEQNGFVTGRVDLRTRLRGRIGGVTHLLVPEVGWAFADAVGQNSDPLYVPETAVPQQRLRELDLDNLVLDPADRIRSLNDLTFGFANSLYGGDGGGLLADFVLKGAYDFQRSRFGWVVLDGRAYPLENATARFHASFDPDAAKMEEALLSVDWRHPAGHRFGLAYRYVRDIPLIFEAFPRQNERYKNYDKIDHIHQLSGRARIALGERWALTYQGAYSIERSLVLANQGGVEYISRCRCWALRVEVAESRSRGVSVAVMYRVLGLGDDTSTPFESGAGSGRVGLLDGL